MHQMNSSKPLNLFVTHVLSDGNVLKIWGQLDGTTTAEIDNALLELEPELEGSRVPHLMNVNPNDICFGKSSEDGKWYRAKIISLSNSTTYGKLGVKFIDYGNSEEIIIQDVKKLTHKITEVEPQASEFILANVISPNTAWDTKTVEFIVEALRYKEVKIVIEGKLGSTPTISIFDSDLGDLAEKLLAMKVAIKDNRINNIYSHINLTKDKNYSVYVTNVTSLDEFYIQLAEAEANLTELNDVITNMTMNESQLQKLPQAVVGAACMAKFSEDDSFYRAKINSAAGNSFRVLYVDYGNSDLKSPDGLYAIPSELVNKLPMQAVKCSLKEWQRIPESMWKVFSEKTDGKELSCRFINKLPEESFEVELFDENGSNFLTILRDIRARPSSNQLTPASFVPFKLEVGNAHEVEVTHVNSLNSFYVRLMTVQSEYEELEEQLFIENNAKVAQVSEQEVVKDLACCVRKNTTWYRSRVIQIISSDLVEIQYVDSGDTDLVPPTRLKRLSPAYIRETPMLARECALNNCTKLSPDLSFDLERITKQKTMLVQVKDKTNGLFMVDLFNLVANPHVEINKQINQMAGMRRVEISEPNLEKIESVYILNVDDYGILHGQLTKFCIEDLEGLQAKLNDFYLKSQVAAVGEFDRFCCTDFIEDSMFYRGEIIKEDRNNFDVYFIDYGNVETKKKETVKVLKPQFADLPRYVIQMKIVGEDFIVNEDFKNAFLDATIQVQILKRGRVNNVVLTTDPTNTVIKRKLAEIQLEQMDQPVTKKFHKYTYPEINDSEEVIATHCVNPNLIGCQLQKSATELTQLCAKTTEYANEPNSKQRKLKNPVVGQPCVADYYGDWFRAEIKRIISGDEVEVCFVDFGNTEKLSLDHVQRISTRFLELPRQCIFCKLSGVDETNWTANDIVVLEEMIKENKFTGVLAFTDDRREPHSITLLNERKQSVNQKYLQAVRPDSIRGARNTSISPKNEPKSQFNYNDAPRRQNSYEARKPFDTGMSNGWQSSSRTSPRSSDNFNRAPKEDSWNNNKPNRFQPPESTGWIGTENNVKSEEFGWNNNKTMKSNDDIKGDEKPLNGDSEWAGPLAAAKPSTSIDNFENRKQPLKHTPFSVSIPESFTGVYKTIPFSAEMTKEVLVAHVTSPFEFYVQLTEFAEKLEALGESLGAVYTDEAPSMKTITPNMPCCTKYSEDDTWYRAQVLKSVGQEVEIRFVDYGNTDKVAPELIKGLKREFSDLPMQGVKCSLFNVKGVNGNWSKDVIEQFIDLVLDKSFTMRVVKEKGNLEVELTDSMKNSVANFMVESGSAVYERVAARTIPNIEIGVGSTINVTLTWFVTPTLFYVHTQNDSQALDRLMDELQNYYSLPENRMLAIPEMKEGIVCACQFSEDEVWYRARIVSIDKGQVKIEYLDFGNAESVPEKKIYGLDERFTALPAQAVKCRLRSIRPIGAKWEKINQTKIETYFGQLSACTFYACHKDAYLVDVENRGVSVAQGLVNDGFAQLTSSCSTSVASTSSEEPTNPYPAFTMDWTKDEYKDVIVCSLGKIDRFWCQLLTSEKPTLSTRINDYYANLPIGEQKLTNPKRGTACVIKSARDDNWHRAVVQTRTSASKLSVLCVDTGIEEIILITQAKNIASEFLEYPIAAFPCSLDGVPSEIDPDEFIRATYMKELVAQIKSLSSDTFDVVLFEISEADEKNLNELLAATACKSVPEPAAPPEYEHANIGDGFISKKSCYYLEKLLSPDCFELLKSFPPIDIEWAIGEDKTVIISGAGRPEQFWCQFPSSLDTLNSLHQRLEDFYSKEAEPETLNLTPCSPCVVKSKVNNKWCRASVIRRPKLDEVEVFLVDTGLIDDVLVNEVRKLDEQFLSIPPALFPCRLSSIDEATVTDSVVCQFFSLAGVELTAKLDKKSQQGVYEVSLFDLSSGEPENILTLLTGKEESERGPDYPEPVTQWEVGKVKNVVVSGVGLPDKFWCQLEEDMDRLEELSKEMSDYYNALSDDKLSVIVPVVGKAVAVQSKSNNKWCRAVIKSITKSSKVTVALVDTGEWEKVPISNIKAIAPQFMQVPIFAVECSLSGIPPNAEIRKLGYDFFNMVVDKNLKAVLDCKKGSVVGITLIDPSSGKEVNLNQKLVAIYQGIGFETINEEIQYNSAVIIPGMQDAFVSHVTTPKKFYIQLAGVEGDLNQLNEELCTLYSTMDLNEGVLPTDALPGRPCCAPFEGVWYRAELLTNAAGNCVTLKFVDYGNAETFSREQVKLLDAEHVTAMAPLAIECQLANAPDREEWSAEEIENFLNMVMENQMSVEFLTVKEPCVVLIRNEAETELLQLPGWAEEIKAIEASKQSTIESTVEEVEKVDIPGFIFQTFPTGKRLLGGTSHIVSPGQFWIQLDGDTSKLEEAVDLLETTYVTNEATAVKLSASELQTGAPCAALYSQDGGWYRGKVLAVEVEDVHIHFVDYGNSDTVKFTAVRRLTPELLDYPVMGIECELSGVCQREDDWSVSAIEQFEELVTERSLLVEFVSHDGERYEVRLMDTGIDVAEKMAEQGFATLKEGYKSHDLSGCATVVETEAEVIEEAEKSDIQSTEESSGNLEDVTTSDETIESVTKGEEVETSGTEEKMTSRSEESGSSEDETPNETIEIMKGEEVERSISQENMTSHSEESGLSEGVLHDYSTSEETVKAESTEMIADVEEMKSENTQNSADEMSAAESVLQAEQEANTEEILEEAIKETEKQEISEEVSDGEELQDANDNKTSEEVSESKELTGTNNKQENVVEPRKESEFVAQNEDPQEANENEASQAIKESFENEESQESSGKLDKSQEIDEAGAESDNEGPLATSEKNSSEPFESLENQLEESFDSTKGPDDVKETQDMSDDVNSFEDGHPVSELSGGFDTQSLLLDEEEDIFVEAEGVDEKMEKFEDLVKVSASSDNESCVTEETSNLSIDYQASISRNLESSLDASRLDMSTPILDAGCTTISSSFEFHAAESPCVKGSEIARMAEVPEAEEVKEEIGGNESV